MNVTTFFKLFGLPLFLALVIGCGGSEPEDDGAEPTQPEPTNPRPEVSMTQGLAYDVNANDLLVNTSADPAKVRAVLTLEETSGVTRAKVTLLEGYADLFR